MNMDYNLHIETAKKIENRSVRYIFSMVVKQVFKKI